MPSSRKSAAPTAGTSGTQQAQQSTQAQANSAQAQANNANKPVLPGHSVVDQISIKITKALQACNDRITVNGSINPHGVPTRYYFEYGTSPSYGQRTEECLSLIHI